jgi:DNA replication protein DnaC
VAQNLSVLLTGQPEIEKVMVIAGAGAKDVPGRIHRFVPAAAKLFRNLAVARADGSLGRTLAKIARSDLLIVDEFAMVTRRMRSVSIFWRSATTVMNSLRPS